jgi:hypothetical protein
MPWAQGGRAFKSPRPDQLKTSALFAMSGFCRTSAPVAICGVLGFLEALNSYKFDYNGLGCLSEYMGTSFVAAP